MKTTNTDERNQSRSGEEGNKSRPDVEGNKSRAGTTVAKYPLFPSTRFRVLFLLTCSAFVVNLNFFSLNFAITCMVNATYLADKQDTTTGGHCYSNDTPIGNHGGDTVVGINTTKSGYDDHLSSTAGYHGTYDWDRTIQSKLLASEGWGAIWLVVLSGYIMDKYGAKWPNFAALILMAAMSLLIPFVAPFGWPWVFGCRFLQAIGIQLAWPTLFSVITRWFPTSELGLVSGIACSGFILGNMVTPLFTGYCCSVQFGWQGAYYVISGTTFLFSLVWIALFSNHVKSTRGIHIKEVIYIKQTRSTSQSIVRRRHPEKGSTKPSPGIPFRQILSSLPVWATIVMNLCGMYVFYLIGDYGATYFKETFGIHSKANGLIMALPFITQLISRNISGISSDYIARRGFLSQTATVKLFTALCGFGSAAGVMAMTLFHCGSSHGAVGFMVAAYFFFGLSLGGFYRSTCLIAPPFTGTIAALGQMASYAAGIVTPYITGALTPNGTPAEWMMAFYVAVGITAVGTIFFLIFGSAEQEPWAGPHDAKKRQPTISR